MRLRKIIASVLFLVLCIAAGASDRKYIVKPRSGDRQTLPFSEGVLVAIPYTSRAISASTPRRTCPRQVQRKRPA